MAPPAATGAEEREYLFRVLFRPLSAYSIAQAAVIIYERSRADALVEKIEAFNDEADKLAE